MSYSKEYLQWVAWMKANKPEILPITNAQHKFVEWALLPENAKFVAMIGDMGTMFRSVREYLKS